MKNNIEITDNSDTDILEEYYPERPLSEKETFDLDRNVGKKILSSKKSILKVISHLKALRRYLMDSDVKWYRKSIVVAALIYFVTPENSLRNFAKAFFINGRAGLKQNAVNPFKGNSNSVEAD